MKIFVAQLNPHIGDLRGNSAKIASFLAQAEREGADLALFPELALTGYPPQDLLLLPHFIKDVEELLQTIAEQSGFCAALIGFPRCEEGKLYNSAALIHQGSVQRTFDKCKLPNYDVFNESRYFTPGSACETFSFQGKKVGVTICEDLWGDPTFAEKPDLILNLSAAPYSVGRVERRTDVCKQAAKKFFAAVVQCNQVGSNDNLIFEGSSLWVNAAGSLNARAGACVEEGILWDLEAPAVAKEPTCSLRTALQLGIADYFKKLQISKAVVGLSGGIDSAVVASLAADALGKENLHALLMPSRYSSKESIEDGVALAEALGISYAVHSIEPYFSCYLTELPTALSSPCEGVTQENIQARIRGNILMAYSNQMGALLLSTGNKSEMAMGYCTLYGDMAGGLSVLGDVTKKQVYALAKEDSRIPSRIVTKPPSAELRPNQKDIDTLPEYSLIDLVLEEYLIYRHSPQEIAEKHQLEPSIVEKLIQRIHANEFKRRQAPLALCVSRHAFSVGRHFPIAEAYEP